MIDRKKTIFGQITSFIPWYEFEKCVKKYNGNYKVKTFKCKHHFLTFLFAQLTNRNSLRDIEVCLNFHRNSLYHIGFGRNKSISKSTISDANEVRDYRIYKDFASILINKARKLCKNETILKDKNFNQKIPRPLGRGLLLKFRYALSLRA